MIEKLTAEQYQAEVEQAALRRRNGWYSAAESTRFTPEAHQRELADLVLLADAHLAVIDEKTAKREQLTAAQVVQHLRLAAELSGALYAKTSNAEYLGQEKAFRDAAEMVKENLVVKEAGK